MTRLYEWSARMDKVFREQVNELVSKDPRTDWNENVSLGMPFPRIVEILGKGLADFNQGYTSTKYKLSSDEVVLLYCFVIMKKHFFACTASFEMHRARIEKRILQKSPPAVIDFGCGPGTACLALADLYPARKFQYFGIDRAIAMRRKARSLWSAGNREGIIAAGSTCRFLKSWGDLSIDDIAPGTPVLLTFSYFFGNPALKANDLKSLAHWVNGLANTREGLPLSWLYVNSPSDLANRKYKAFKTELGLDSDTPLPAAASIRYRKKRNGDPSPLETFVHQMVGFRGR